MFERRLDTQSCKLVDYVAVRGPVLESLEVVVEAVSHVRAPLVDNDPPPRLVCRQSGGEPRWTGPEHVDWLQGDLPGFIILRCCSVHACIESAQICTLARWASVRTARACADDASMVQCALPIALCAA